MFIFRKQFYFVVSGLKMIGHGIADNNLETAYIITITITGINTATDTVTITATATDTVTATVTVNGRRAILL
jgi:hypothetical protein